jgi:murein DD-endopeptidase MepM/ murein hydrolase activator NlpD
LRVANYVLLVARRSLKLFVLLAGLCALMWAGASLTRATTGGMGVATSGWVTTLFLEPITYENADYYFDHNNQLQYSSYIFHHGIDVSGGCYAGTYPVYAAADGIVALAQYINDGYGTQVAIDHGWNVGGNGRYTYTFYGHMGNRVTGDRYIVVSPGQFVRAGQLLGYQGNDGTSFGSCPPDPGTHLDWEIRLSNVPVGYSTAMRYSAIAASTNYYVNQQLTYGLPNPVERVTAGPFPGGGGSTPTPTPMPTPTVAPGPCGMQFSDLPTSHWAYDYIGYLYCRNVVSGFGDGTFRPDAETSRAEFTKWISLAFGWNLYNPYFPSFSDVPRTHPYYQYIETAKLRGIIVGYGDGTFRPTNTVTRAQATKMIVLSKGWPIVNPQSPTFPDVLGDNWSYGYVETALRRGIVGGFGDGTFRPNFPLTRAHLSKMLALSLQQARSGP